MTYNSECFLSGGPAQLPDFTDVSPANGQALPLHARRSYAKWIGDGGSFQMRNSLRPGNPSSIILIFTLVWTQPWYEGLLMKPENLARHVHFNSGDFPVFINEFRTLGNWYLDKKIREQHRLYVVQGFNPFLQSQPPWSNQRQARTRRYCSKILLLEIRSQG